MKHAIVLCSGGLDSVTTAHLIKKKLNYNKVKILFFNYKQRNLNAEKKCAKNCAKSINAQFIEVYLPELNKISTSLLNTSKKVKKIRNIKNTKSESNKYYVPCRNTIFLTYALAFAESECIKNKNINDIFVGFKHEGQEHYPDTTPMFVKQINKLSKISCKQPFKILAQLIKKDKEDIIQLAKKLDVNLKDTFSCYINNDMHCGICLSCILRKQGFYWANIKDPTIYKEK